MVHLGISDGNWVWRVGWSEGTDWQPWVKVERWVGLFNAMWRRVGFSLKTMKSPWIGGDRDVKGHYVLGGRLWQCCNEIGKARSKSRGDQSGSYGRADVLIDGAQKWHGDGNDAIGWRTPVKGWRGNPGVNHRVEEESERSDENQERWGSQEQKAEVLKSCSRMCIWLLSSDRGWPPRASLWSEYLACRGEVPIHLGT